MDEISSIEYGFSYTIERPETIQKTIKKFKQQLRYSKNPMEQRQLRSKLGQLERDLKYSETYYAKEEKNDNYKTCF